MERGAFVIDGAALSWCGGAMRGAAGGGACRGALRGMDRWGHRCPLRDGDG